MILVRTPLRVSFAGGGTDLPAYYQKGAVGAVTNAAIGAYIYVTLGKHWDPKRIRLSYSKTENVGTVREISHELVREAMHHFGAKPGLEITTIGQIPGKGIGLGSSSSTTVGIYHALAAHRGMDPSAEWLAEAACMVELTLLKHPGGKQDQYAAAFGGINHMTFNPKGRVTVDQINVPFAALKQMTDRFPLYYTNLTRQSKRILSRTARQLAIKDHSWAEAKATVGLAAQAREALRDGRLEDLGQIMHEGWERKRRINEDASTEEIDELYEKALKAGAIGGKLCGAGGGGFFVFYVPEEKLAQVDRALVLLRRINISYGVPGSQVVYQDEASF